MGARITTFRLTPSAGQAAPRLKIALLADFHCNQPFMTSKKIAGIVDQTNELNPDLTLLLGDYAGHVLFCRELDPDVVARLLADLRAPLGVHAIFGNHDWYSDKTAREARLPTIWHKAFEAAGIQTYSNSACTLDTTPPITLAGLESQQLYRATPFRSKPVGADDWPALAATLDPDHFICLMAHEPTIFPHLPDWVDLTVSGHTHGGQIAPGGIPFMMPAHYGRRYAHGHFKEQSKQMIVSRGLGYSTIPLRIGSPPEIVILEIANGVHT